MAILSIYSNWILTYQWCDIMGYYNGSDIKINEENNAYVGEMLHIENIPYINNNAKIIIYTYIRIPGYRIITDNIMV